MKIDPVTGKTYLHDWQRDLDRLHHAGFSYGYVEIVDLATGEHTWQVDAMKGDGPRVAVEMPTLEEAVNELRCLVIVQTCCATLAASPCPIKVQARN